MKVSCPTCGAGYTVAPEKIPSKGGRLTCPACRKQWSIFPPEAGSDPADATRPARTRSRPDLPPAPAPLPVTAPPASRQVACPKCGHEFVPRAAAPPVPEPAAPRRRAPARAAGERKTILLVEDQAYFSEVAREALGPAYRTVSVGTKEEALKIIESDPPQLMILDLSLARGQDGRDLLRAIPDKQFPILIFTARDETDLYGEPWRELKDLGADGIVLKTMNVGEELRQKVSDLLEAD